MLVHVCPRMVNEVSLIFPQKIRNRICVLIVWSTVYISPLLSEFPWKVSKDGSLTIVIFQKWFLYLVGIRRQKPDDCHFSEMISVSGDLDVFALEIKLRFHVVKQVILCSTQYSFNKHNKKGGKGCIGFNSVHIVLLFLCKHVYCK